MTRGQFCAVAAIVGTLGCGSGSTTTAPTATDTTVTWTTLIGPGGLVTRSFAPTAAGAARITLTAAAVPVGMGIGVPKLGTSGCRLAISQTAVPGTSLSTPVDGGDYCIEVYDVGGIVEPVPFTLELVHP